MFDLEETRTGTGAGQERWVAELGEFVRYVEEIRKDNEGLRARLEGMEKSIHSHYSNVFEVEKSPNKPQPF